MRKITLIAVIVFTVILLLFSLDFAVASAENEYKTAEMYIVELNMYPDLSRKSYEKKDIFVKGYIREFSEKNKSMYLVYGSKMMDRKFKVEFTIVNAQTLKKLKTNEVYVFKVRCNTVGFYSGYICKYINHFKFEDTKFENDYEYDDD